MCKIRVVHFSAHHVRVPVATSLFGGPETDLVSPAIVHRCECDFKAYELLRSSANQSWAGCPPLENCPWHNCCLKFVQIVMCAWYWDNREVEGLDELEEPEEACPNCFMVNEYQHISMVVDFKAEEAPQWQFPEAIPLFPAEELYYSKRIVDPDSVDDRSNGFHHDRFLMLDLAGHLWESKQKLARASFGASAWLDSVEYELSETLATRFQGFAQDSSALLERVKLTRNFVRSAQFAELDAVTDYRDLMKLTGFVLTGLNKMPDEGQSVTAGNGLYSISREELDMANLSLSEIILACGGPYKQVGMLEERMQAVDRKVNDFLEVRTTLRKRRASNAGRGTSKRGMIIKSARKAIRERRNSL